MFKTPKREEDVHQLKSLFFYDLNETDIVFILIFDIPSPYVKKNYQC